MKPRPRSQSERFLQSQRAARGADPEASLLALGKFARQIFVDRNAHGWNKPGMPKGDRLAIKAEARPFLREAIRWARKSRNALLAGDIDLHELLRDRARMYRAFAALEFFQPYANKLGWQRLGLKANSDIGAATTASKFAQPDLEDLVWARLERGENTRGVVTKEWARDCKLSPSTIRRRVRRIEAKFKAKQ